MRLLIFSSSSAGIQSTTSLAVGHTENFMEEVLVGLICAAKPETGAKAKRRSSCSGRSCREVRAITGGEAEVMATKARMQLFWCSYYKQFSPPVQAYESKA